MEIISVPSDEISKIRFLPVVLHQYLESLYSKVIIIFPRACPSSECRIAAATSLNR